MSTDNFEEKISTEIQDILLGRVFKKLYILLPEDKQKNMAEIFFSDDENTKTEFLNENKEKFELIFQQEAEILKKELADKVNI